MKRSDGTRIKAEDPFAELIPYVLDSRTAAQNFSKHIFVTESIDSYIQEKRAAGHKISYLHFFIAAYVRLLAERPQLNRFIISSKVYQRNNICISMVVKRSFRENGEETTVKFEFTGQENIFEVAEIINNYIAEAKTDGISTETDKLVTGLMSMPGFFNKFLVKGLLGLDKVNLLPASIIKVSPFHTSLFFTHLKSIKTDYIYHHLYEVGTAGIFVALGKTAKIPVVVNDELVIKKCVTVGYTVDERICDGVYFARSFRQLERFLENPQLLEEGPKKES